MILLLSYPRSGSHLVRFLLEYVSGASTQGCLNNVNDVRICSNYFPGNENVLAHVSKDRIIAQKAHSISEQAHYLSVFGYRWSSILILLRHPIEAITSNFAKFKDLFQNQNDQVLACEMKAWFDIASFYLKSPHSNVELISYVDLVSGGEKSKLDVLFRLSKTLAPNLDVGNISRVFSDWETLLAISRSGEGRDWGGVGKRVPLAPYARSLLMRFVLSPTWRCRTSTINYREQVKSTIRLGSSDCQRF